VRPGGSPDVRGHSPKPGRWHGAWSYPAAALRGPRAQRACSTSGRFLVGLGWKNRSLPRCKSSCLQPDAVTCGPWLTTPREPTRTEPAVRARPTQPGREHSPARTSVTRAHAPGLGHARSGCTSSDPPRLASSPSSSTPKHPGSRAIRVITPSNFKSLGDQRFSNGGPGPISNGTPVKHTVLSHSFFLILIYNPSLKLPFSLLSIVHCALHFAPLFFHRRTDTNKLVQALQSALTDLTSTFLWKGGSV